MRSQRRHNRKGCRKFAAQGNNIQGVRNVRIQRVCRNDLRNFPGSALTEQMIISAYICSMHIWVTFLLYFRAILRPPMRRLSASLQPGIRMVIRRAGIGDQPRNPPDALLQVWIIGSQTILAWCDQDGLKGQEVPIIRILRRSPEDRFRRLMKTGPPPIGSRSHCERIRYLKNMAMRVGQACNMAGSRCSRSTRHSTRQHARKA